LLVPAGLVPSAMFLPDAAFVNETASYLV